MFSFEKRTHFAAVAHLVERHLAKVEVASSSLVGRSTNNKIPASCRYFVYMVTWPSGKARVCKTLIHQFKSGRHLQVKWSFWITATFFVVMSKATGLSALPKVAAGRMITRRGFGGFSGPGVRLYKAACRSLAGERPPLFHHVQKKSREGRKSCRRRFGCLFVQFVED